MSRHTSIKVALAAARLLETVDTTGLFPKVVRKDYTIGLNLTGNGIDAE